MPASITREKAEGIVSLIYKGSVIGMRLSPYVAFCCFLMGVVVIIW